MKQIKLFFALCVTLGMTQAFGFGYSGSDGSNGSDGSDGRNGQDIVTVADGSEQNYIINGTNGTDGGDASAGSSASSCYHDTGRSNEYGASGGDGGRGGDGGDGGRGGDVTIFYKDINQLKNIFIEAIGGYGANGGYGASGGYGCRCSTYSWSHESCSTSQQCTTTESCSRSRDCDSEGNCRMVRTCTPSTSCRDVTSCSDTYYSCSDGSDGSSGRDGYNGSNGRLGKVKIIKDITELPAEFISTTMTFEEAIKVDMEFAKQIWESKTGMKALLAAGSVVNDTYSEYSHLATRKFRFIWGAKRSMDEFKKAKVKLSFDGKTVSFKLPGDLFIRKEVKELDGVTQVTVTKIFKKDELEKLKIEKTTGHSKRLQITVDDAAAVSTEVETKVHLQFVHRKMLRWFVVYDQEVPADKIQIVDNKIVINVGELGIPRKFIKRKKRVRYTLNISRSFECQSTKVKLHQGKIKLR